MIYAFDDTEIDTALREVRRAGVRQQVEPQVFDVLVYLIDNNDRVVTKIELFDEVWGSRFVSESALTSRIKTARQLCGDDGRAQRIIRTHRGRGYRFVADLTDDGTPGLRDVSVRGETIPSMQLAAPVRTRELAVLERALDEAVGGMRRTVFVTGDAGIGKSELVRAFAEGVGEGVATLWGQCLDQRGSAEPFFCLLDALSRYARSAGSHVVEILERVAPSWLAQMPSLYDEGTARRLERKLLGSTRVRMLREGVDAIDAIAQDGSLVLVLEDLHWADGPTLDVVELLSMRSGPGTVLLVGTARHEPGPATGLIERCTASRGAVELRLDGLDEAGLGDIAQEWSDGVVVDPALVAALHRGSGGVPLFAREILAAWTRARNVTVDGGRLVSVGEFDPDAAPVPETVRQLVRRELTTLTADELAVLQAGAVVGVEFDGAAVAGGIGRDLDAVENELFALADRHRYLEALGGSAWPNGVVSTRFAFTHDIYRRVTCDGMVPSQLIELHRAIGVTIEAGYAAQIDERVAELAHHFVEGGDAWLAVEYLRRAGEQAVGRSAHAEALELLHAALEQTTRLPRGAERDRAELRIRMVLGPVLVAIRGWSGHAVAETYERVLELCEREGPDCPEWAVAQHGLATVTELRGQYETTQRLLQPLVADDEAGGVRLEANELLACSTFHQGNFERALTHAQRVIDRYDPDDFNRSMAQLAEHPLQACSSWASLAAWFLGRSDESLRHAGDAIDACDERLYALSTAQVQLAFLHQLRDEVAESLFWSEAAIETADAQGFPFRAIQADAIAGWAMARTGHVDDGIARLTDAMERYEASTARLTQPWFIGLQAEVALIADDPVAAIGLTERALAAMHETTRRFFYEAELHRMRALAAMAAHGDRSAAADALGVALRVAQQLASPPLQLRAVIHCFDLGFDTHEVDGFGGRPELARLVAGYEGQSDFPDLVAGRELLAKTPS